MLFVPCPQDFRITGSGLFACANELKHLLQAPVATVAVSALKYDINWQAQTARVAETEVVLAFHDQDWNTIREVGVNKRIDEGFAQRFVNVIFIDAFAI